MSAFTFLFALVTDPRRVSALAPSSPALAHAITAEITPVSAPVIELGPGTGVFTRALLARGVPEDKLALIEFGPDFARMLRSRFPGIKVLRMDAAQLKEIELFDGESVGAVVSGLPLLSMPANKVIAILDGAFAHLRPDGAFYQFTYGPRCPVSRSILDRLGLKAIRIGNALANVPPAAVYRIHRRQPKQVGLLPPRHHGNFSLGPLQHSFQSNHCDAADARKCRSTDKESSQCPGVDGE